ncbi:MAG: IS1595 family transposase [Candidatus Binatus sp.]|uniref:IS1595 family transposase n=1 Tax=Candidatus Binatus sp. TaxID=2811406 RepID=UPI003C7489E8
MAKTDKHQPRFVRQMTLSDFDALFPDENACRTYLLLRRWPGGPKCPRCQNDHVYESTARPWHWQCMKCGPKPRSPYRFALTTGTIFEESKKPLIMWFKVLHLMVTSKKGISALQIHRMLGTGSYQTAWYMCMRLRAGMQDPEFRQLMGIVEVDETFIGGLNKNRHSKDRIKGTGGPASGKITVVGAIARKGNVVCKIVERTDTDSLTGFVREVTKAHATLVITDEFRAYDAIGIYNREHQFVRHSAGEYVRGNVHTNTIESFWSLLKRGVIGTYHHVSKKYLPLYLNEFQFRFNNRNEADIFGKAIGGC